MHSYLYKNQFLVPSITSSIISQAYLRNIFKRNIWVPKTTDFHAIQCLNPPTSKVLSTKILELAGAQGLKVGIDLGR